MLKDPIPFLANIIAVAHTDGSLSVAENIQIEAIRTELNFKKSNRGQGRSDRV
jgi:hypothetical protein